MNFDFEEKEIAPVGDFILKSGAPYQQLETGAFFHYITVIKLLKEYVRSDHPSKPKQPQPLSLTPIMVYANERPDMSEVLSACGLKQADPIDLLFDVSFSWPE